MKLLKLLIVLITVMFISCKSKSNTRNFTGQFTNQSKSEYSIATDTLTITPLNNSEKSFQIERRTGYQKITNGVRQPKEYRVEKWQSTWNEDKQILSEADYGRQITPGNDGQSLTLKTTRYQRTN